MYLLPLGPSSTGILSRQESVRKSTWHRRFADPHRLELDVVSLFYAPTATVLVGMSQVSKARPREMRLLEGFRTVPTTLVALVSEPSGTLSQPSGQS